MDGAIKTEEQSSQRSTSSPAVNDDDDVADGDEDVNVDADSDADDSSEAAAAALEGGGSKDTMPSNPMLSPRFPLGFPIVSVANSPNWSPSSSSLPRPSPSFPWLPHIRSPMGLPGLIPSKYSYNLIMSEQFPRAKIIDSFIHLLLILPIIGGK